MRSGKGQVSEQGSAAKACYPGAKACGDTILKVGFHGGPSSGKRWANSVTNGLDLRTGCFSESLGDVLLLRDPM